MSLENIPRGRNEHHEPVFDARETLHAIFNADGTPHLEDELKETNAGEHHVSNLYDENEDKTGEKIDLATGKPIDNSSSDPLDGLDIHDSASLLHDDAAGDEADEWLKKNDPNYRRHA